MGSEITAKVRISRSALLTLIFGALSLGIFIGAGMTGIVAPFHSDKGDDSSGEGTFKFIRTSLVMPKDSDGRRRVVGELKPFRYKIKELIEEKVNKNEAQSISVYFRDLNNGNWIGIGEREIFSAKTLLKVPLMIAYFKWAETNPLVLRRTLTYENPKNPAEQKQALPGSELEAGKSYSVNDLIFRMIAHDDPVAYSLLLAHIPQPRLDRVFTDLNVEYDPRKKEDTLTLRGFASFYRVLFNASYLSEEMSEKALRYLSKTSFKDGMASGIPMTTEIANKFGERTVEVKSADGEKELHQVHEFGIIYHPRRPFLLGVMARGDDYDALVKTIRDVTRQIYEEVDQQS